MTQTQAEFRQYCLNCTDAQLRNVYAKESLARRRSFAAIARAVMRERGL